MREDSWKERLQESHLPLKCLLPLFFLRTVMFFAELGLMTGEDSRQGLWIVKGSRCSDSFRRSISISLPMELVGELNGVAEGEIKHKGAFPLESERFGSKRTSILDDDEEEGIIWMGTFNWDRSLPIGTRDGDLTGISSGGSSGGGWGEKVESLAALRSPIDKDLGMGLEGDFTILGKRKGQ